MATGNANLQRSFLNTCIDDNLARIIDRETESTNPTTYSGGAEASTIGILDKYFDNLHPIHVRLNEMVSLYPYTNQTPVRYYAEFIKIANKADTRNMTAELLIVAMMTSRCPNENLKMDLLKDKLSMDEVYDKAQHQSAWKTVNKPQDTTATANKCYLCNRTGHTQASCWTHKAYCPNCGKTGLAAKKCRVKQAKTKRTRKLRRAPTQQMYVCIEVTLRRDAHGIGRSNWAKGSDPSGSWVQYPNPAVPSTDRQTDRHHNNGLPAKMLSPFFAHSTFTFHSQNTHTSMTQRG